MKVGESVILVLAIAGCGPVGGSATAPEMGPAAAAAAPAMDFSDYAGRSYADFLAAHQDRFGPDALGLSVEEAARLRRVMAGATGAALEGGGAEALVFRGCAETGCADGVGVVAIDAATGAAFVGVKDSAGKVVLAPNDRLEALLRLNAPTRDWLDAAPQRHGPDAAASPARP